MKDKVKELYLLVDRLPIDYQNITLHPPEKKDTDMYCMHAKFINNQYTEEKSYFTIKTKEGVGQVGKCTICGHVHIKLC